MRTKKLEQLITDNESKINFGDTDNLHSLPCTAEIYHQAYQYHLEIKVEADSNEFICQIFKGENQVDLTEEQLDYVFNTFTDLLNEKIYHAKNLFYEHQYNQIYNE
tara:strand:- start:24 stop:341 length:318 start_codon:yes stop_codon:yes gene_type:complete